MKKNRTMRAAALLLALTLITSCFVGGTFAKYTSSTSASDTVTVAKWQVKVDNKDIAGVANPGVTFDLFNTIKDTGGTLDEGNVATGKIAPGTEGSFVLTVENLSEVDAKYNLSYSIDKSHNIPLQFKLEGGTWETDIATLNVTNVDLNMSDATKYQEITVYWRWCYEGTDPGAPTGQTNTTDTDLGVLAKDPGTAPTVKVTAEITVWQVD